MTSVAVSCFAGSLLSGRHRHHHKHHRCIKLSPREKQGLAFIFSELLLIAAFLLQLGTFRVGFNGQWQKVLTEL